LENHDHAQALRTFYTCAATLQQELGVDPSPLTVAIYQRIFQHQTVLDAAAMTNLAQPVTLTSKRAVAAASAPSGEPVSPAVAEQSSNAPPSAGASQVHPLPVATTPFIGRHA